jgi:hypothetical protein
MKVCKKCNVEHSESFFYKVKGNIDGLSGKCKDCAKKDVRLNYRENIEHYKQYDQDRAMLPHRVEARAKYQNTDAGKKSLRKAHLKFCQENPIKRNAHVIVGNAIRDKRLFKEPCEVCGTEEKINAHHDDYLKPLNVRWLCASHHRQWHIKNGEAKNGS